MADILVIDDDDMITESMVTTLELKGHTAKASRKGEIPEGFVPDVVICDWDLGMYDHRNGGEIVIDLRAELPNARYIICSGLDRTVPEGVEFFNKGQVIELLRSLDG